MIIMKIIGLVRQYTSPLVIAGLFGNVQRREDIGYRPHLLQSLEMSSRRYITTANHLSIILSTALGCHSGDVAVSHLYKTTACMQYRYVEMVLGG